MYASGLELMDAHVVVEVAAGGVWGVGDPTRLFPRVSMVRIGGGEPPPITTASEVTANAQSDL